MAYQSLNTLKEWFRKGLKPLSQQFWDWMDSFYHKSENIPAAKVEGLGNLLDEKVSDAPKNGNPHARQDGDWVEISTGGASETSEVAVTDYVAETLAEIETPLSGALIQLKQAIKAMQEEIASLAQAALSIAASPVPYTLTTVEQTMPFIVEAASTNTDIIEANANTNTITAKAVARYQWLTSLILENTSNNTDHIVTIRTRKVSDGTPITQRTVEVKAKTTVPFPKNVTFEVAEGEAPLELYITLESTDDNDVILHSLETTLSTGGVNVSGGTALPNTWVTNATAVRALTDYTNDQDVGIYETATIYEFVNSITDADDGDNFLKPDDIDAADPGRWVKRKTFLTKEAIQSKELVFSETISITSALQHSLLITQSSTLNFVKGVCSYILGVYQVTANLNGSPLVFTSDFIVYSNDYIDSEAGIYDLMFALFPDGKVRVNIITTNQIAANLPTVTTQAVSAITSVLATGNGTVTADGGEDVTDRGIVWSENPNPTLTDQSATGGFGLGIFTAAITGLTNGVLYYVRAYATNANGTTYGDQVSFTANETLTDPATLNPQFLYEGFNPDNGALPVDQTSVTTVINRGTATINETKINATKAGTGNFIFRNVGGKVYIQNSNNVHLDVLSGEYNQPYTAIIAMSPDAVGRFQELIASKITGNRSFGRINEGNEITAWATSSFLYTGGTLATGQDYVVQFVFNGGSSKIRVNNGVWTNGALGDGAFTDFTLMASNAGSIANVLLGKFYGALVKNEVMSDVDIQKVVDWFSQKGGMSL